MFMRVLFWYCDNFDWNPAIKTIEEVPDAQPFGCTNAVVAFIHVEPKDLDPASSAETKLVKNSKWLARKWSVNQIVLHSFTHLGEEKADPDMAQAVLNNAQVRLETSGYDTIQTPYGYFLDLSIKAKGHPLARIYKEF
ncbi:ThrS1 [Desulforapulum autotrophicum HRM2]|uniref:ThrS1 n=1 Tax=Desulforapulum autotrophicum (strain ATCC 43914 / DSM 3382 / VKM B-1955 / HRM2) TaxID=177437 RepID=C0QJQ1_DESAH|nr:threonyl-tRNA synthetase editing domain-containing protein [Desulforapulum autotrophicum]ACN13904.1 ThrS1 [Desulforapulum autotrophicum HRM2]